MLRIRSPCSVVGYLDPQHAIVRDADVDPARAGMLDRVGERLGDREVTGRLHGRRQPPAQADVQVDRHRRVQREGPDRWAEAAVGQHRRVDAADQIPQVVQRAQRRLPCLGDQGQRGLRAHRQHPLDRPQVHAERDQPGLRPVVQVPLDPAQLGAGRVDGVATGLGQPLHPAGQVGIGTHHAPRVRDDRPRHQPHGEREEYARLRPGQQSRLPAVHEHRAVLHRRPRPSERHRLPARGGLEAAHREQRERGRHQVRGRVRPAERHD